MSIELESVKKIILCFLNDKGMNIENCLEGDYEIDWDEEFKKEMTEFIDAMKLFEESIKAGDKTAQVCSLMWARIRSLRLSGFFQDLFEDVEYLYLSEDFDWPSIPEDYIVEESLFPKGNVLKDVLGK